MPRSSTIAMVTIQRSFLSERVCVAHATMTSAYHIMHALAGQAQCEHAQSTHCLYCQSALARPARPEDKRQSQHRSCTSRARVVLPGLDIFIPGGGTQVNKYTYSPESLPLGSQ